MSISEKQLNANRRNAQKSTGPKTESGRSRSRYNAVKRHGPDTCLGVKQSHFPDIVQQLAEVITDFTSRCETNPLFERVI